MPFLRILRTSPFWWWALVPSSHCCSTWAPGRGASSWSRSQMNTAPYWPPPRPAPCCSGNTGFGSRPFTRYVTGQNWLGRVPVSHLTLTLGLQAEWPIDEQTDFPFHSMADIASQLLLSSPPDRLWSLRVDQVSAAASPQCPRWWKWRRALSDP